MQAMTCPKCSFRKLMYEPAFNGYPGRHRCYICVFLQEDTPVIVMPVIPAEPVKNKLNLSEDEREKRRQVSRRNYYGRKRLEQQRQARGAV
jgi:hypothetical protein